MSILFRFDILRVPQETNKNPFKTWQSQKTHSSSEELELESDDDSDSGSGSGSAGKSVV